MEKKLLTWVVHDKKAILRVLERGIKSYLFDNKEYAEIYRIVLSFFNEYKVIPSFEIFEKFVINFPVVGGIDKTKLVVLYAELLAEGIDTEESLEFVIDYLVKLYRTRKIKEEIISCAGDLTPEKVDETSDKLTRKIAHIRNFGRYDGTEGDYREAGIECREQYLEAQQGKSVGLHYGLPTLDRETGGQPPETLWIVLGYMKAGKSTLMLGMANSAWQQGKNIVYFSAEVSKRVLTRKLNALNTSLPMSALKQGTLDQDSEVKFFSYLDTLTQKTNTFYIVDRGGMTTDYIAAKVVELSNIMHIDLVVVDYLGICRTNNCVTKNSSPEYIGQIAWDLRDIAKKCHVPVLTAHQSNKERGISKSLDVGRHCDLMLKIDLVDENQLLMSELVNMQANIFLSRESGCRQFELEANFSFSQIREPVAQRYGNATDVNQESTEEEDNGEYPSVL